MDRLLNLLAFVGQPILAAAAFQAALSRHARVFAPGERSPKAGGRQDWPPHNLSGLVSGIQRKCHRVVNRRKRLPHFGAGG
jgi:hypothetical protein